MELLDYIPYLETAVSYARESLHNGGFPNGSLIIMEGTVVGEGVFRASGTPDPTAHMEVTAIRNACSALGTADLSGAVLVSSLEPCLMCFYSAYWAGIGTILYGCQKEGIQVPRGYASTLTIEEAAETAHRPIRVELLPGFEEEMKTLLEEWNINSA